MKTSFDFPDSDSDLDDGSAHQAGTHNRSQQTNTIQIDKPVGATTIIINADFEKSVGQNTAEFSHGWTPKSPPSDLSGIGAPPTRPKKYPFSYH